MGNLTAAEVAATIDHSEILKAIKDLIEESDKYIIPEKRKDFSLQAETALSNLKVTLVEVLSRKSYVHSREVWNEIKKKWHEIRAGDLSEIFKATKDLIEEIDKYIIPEKKLEFDFQVTLEFGNFIETLGKGAKINSNGNWNKVKKKLHVLRTKLETLKRRLELLNPSNQQDIEATLWWMAEQGVEEDVDLLRKVKQDPPYSSENIKRLLEIAEERITERIYDPAPVLRKGEEAYQRNKAEWDQTYVGQCIAIHRGQVLDSDRDKSKLIERIVKAQREQGPFRAYIVVIGAPVLKARGPRVRLLRKIRPEAEPESVAISETDVQRVGWAAFRRELPQLLQQARGQWVAFHGERQVALDESKLGVYRQLERAGAPLREVVVSRIAPLGPPVDLRRFRRLRRR